ncbi:MAG: curli assembly protein CsgF, partial [Thermodesulfobacteriota bacterium]
MNKLLIFITLVSLCCTATASPMTFQFKSPAFNGQGYSNHVLAIEQLETKRANDIEDERSAEQARIQRELENSTLNKFIRNVESRIYATLSKQMVDNMFSDCSGEDCSEPVTGTAEIEGNTITWQRDSITGDITLSVNGP